MGKNRKELLMEQANKVEGVFNVLRTQFREDYENEVYYLEIVKGKLSNS